LIKKETLTFSKLIKKIEVKENNFYIKAKPSNTLNFHYTIEFKNTPIGKQKQRYVFSKKSFIDEISMARTFGIVDNLEQAQSFYKGATLQNTLIISQGKLLSTERIKNEFVKHKILDAMGDILTFGHPMIMEYNSFGGSHKLNNLLLKKIKKENAYEIIQIHSSQNVIEKNYAFAYSQ